jgi:hypothetical protein
LINSKENNNYFLNHFFEILFYYEEILLNFAKKNTNIFNILINNLYIKTKYKIDFLIKLNMKKRIFQENKKIRDRENNLINLKNIYKF